MRNSFPQKQPSPREIWLCRHGNRMDFVDPNWKGFNPPLSPDGLIQAQETAIRLQGEKIDHIFSSPFLRTIQTAHAIAELLNVSVKVEHGICEWLNPEWFMEHPPFPSNEEMIKTFPRIDTEYQSVSFPSFPETWDQCMTRCKRMINLLLKQYLGNLLLVGHGATVEGMVRGISSDLTPASSGMCALTMIQEINGSYAFKINGDTSHLSDGDQFKNRLV